MKRAGLAATVLFSGLVLYGCPGTDTDIGPDAGLDSLYVEPSNGVMVLDDTLHFTAIGVDSSGRRFVTTHVTWSSTDPAINLAANGAAVGVQVGTATVQANSGGVTGSTTVSVQPRPIFSMSSDSVPFSGFANGPDPAPQTAIITNGGGGTLTPAIDSVRYGAGATGWLTAGIVTGAGNDTLALSAATTGIAVGTYTASVFLGSSKATPKTIKVVLTMGVDAPSAMVIDSGDAQTATVNTGVAIKPTVRLRDQYNNPVPGASVTFSVTGGGGSVAPVTAVTTDVAGRARVTSWTMGTTAGPNSLQAAASGVSSVTFNATGTAGAPANASKNAGDAQSVTVNTAVPVKPTLLVTDQFGNPVESVTVTFNVATGGGSLTGGTKKTDGSGLAAVGSWTLGTVAGSNTLSATATGLTPATFSATGTADVADSIKLNAGNNQTDTVKATLATYSVRVADQFGNGVSGRTVTWGVTGGGSITPSSITNGSGIASATRVFGTAAGGQDATATVTGLVGSPVAFSATATHGAATTILKFSGDGQSATAGSPVAIPPTARVVDSYGNSVSGVNVTFAVTGGGGSVAPTSAIATDTAGKATVASWTLGPSAGTNNDSLAASASGLPSVMFLASGLSGAAQNLVSVSGTAQTDTIGATLAAYTVRVTDINNNGVQGVSIIWLVTAGGGSITPSSITDVNGFATATRVLGTAAGVDSATASVGVPNGSPQRFGATALHGNPNQIFKTAGDGQSATVNTSVTTAPQVQITDRALNPIASAGVTFTVSGGGGSTSPGSPAGLSTNGSGFAQLTSWTLGTGAGANSISVTSTGTPGASFSATGTAGAPSASQSTVLDGATANVTACSVSCTVAGGTADSVTVTVLDQFNNPVSGASVTVSSTGINNTFSPAASGTSNGNGVYAVKLNSTTAQAKTISASATTALGGGAITQTAAVTVNPAGVSASQSSVAVGTASITACSASCVAGSTASTVTITVRDAFNNLISGASVTPASTGTGNTFNPSSGSSAGGVFSTTFNSTVAQGKTISASANAIGITQTGAVTVNAAAPFSVSVTNSGFSARVGTGQSTLPTYTVRDQFSNLVPNFAVSYSSSFSGAFSGPGTTNGSGQATLTSWTMSGSNSDDAFGRMANSVTLFAGSASNTATDYGIYTWSGDATAVIGPSFSTCSSCHAWNRNPNNIVSVASSCAGWNLVAAGAAGSSYIYTKMLGTAACAGSPMPPPGGSSAANLKIIRAWINNGALNN